MSVRSKLLQKSVTAAAVLITVLMGLSGCSSSPERAETDDHVETEKEGITGEMVEGVTVDSQVCSGNLVPPTGYRQETAFVSLSTPGPYDAAAEQARARLRDLICQGYRCDQAESMITIWRVGEDGRRACVMAVASARNIDEFESGPRRNLEAGLVEVAAEISERLAEETNDPTPTVVVDTINDNGVNGGPRAEWLHDQLLTALAQRSVDTRRPPPRWSGLGAPSATTGVIRGSIRELPGQEAILEVTWQLELAENRVRGVGNVQFPLAISPDVDRDTYMTPLPRGSGKVSLHLDSRPGGALCNGQQTELWLETAEPLHVRVLNLYGGGEGGLVIYSTDGEPLASNHPVSLGQFRAVKTSSTPVERFIVIAAPTEEKLGRFASIDRACRLPGTMSYALHEGRSLPADAMEWITSLDYRLMSGDECSDVEPAGMVDMSAIAQLPSCW